ncbi:MAG: hypothetical protein FJX76_24955 [Armatimonadetes bacterium]|nr:hypothetical protein [Armatimonadota bacterium]
MALLGEFILFALVFALPLIVLSALGQFHARSLRQRAEAARRDAARVAARFARMEQEQAAQRALLPVRRKAA